MAMLIENLKPEIKKIVETDLKKYNPNQNNMIDDEEIPTLLSASNYTNIEDLMEIPVENIAEPTVAKHKDGLFRRLQKMTGAMGYLGNAVVGATWFTSLVLAGNGGTKKMRTIAKIIAAITSIPIGTLFASVLGFGTND